MKRLWMLAIAAALVSPVRAADKPSPMDDLAAQYNMPKAQLDDMRGKGLSWGEIGRSMAVSQRAGVPIGDVRGQREAGKSWNEIAHGYGFAMKDVSRQGRDAERAGMRAERAEHGGMHGHEGGGHDQMGGHGDMGPADRGQHGPTDGGPHGEMGGGRHP